MRSFPDDWALFRQDPDGYRWLSSSVNRPDPETLAALLAWGGSRWS